MSRKALAIVRASSERQETESQRKELIDFLCSKGYGIDEIEILESAGASARKCNSKYLELLETIKQRTNKDTGDVNVVGLWHINRLGRVETKLCEMKDWFINNKVQVLIKNPSIQLFKEDGTLDVGVSISWAIFAAMVELDTKEMFSKMKRGKRRNAKDKKYNGGGNIKYGYEIKDGYFVTNAEEAEVIKLIFSEYASAKYSIKSLQDELNARGIRLRNQPITQSLINKIIKDTAYIGYKDLVSEDEDSGNVSYKRYYPAFIDKDIWERAEAIREGRIQTVKDKTTSGEIHFALKILKCSACGYNYIHSHDYYTCFQRAAGFKNITTPNRCKGSVGISDHFIDDLLWEVARLYHISHLKDNNAEILNDYIEKIKIQESKLSESLRQRESVEERLKRLAFTYSDLLISSEDYNKKRNKILADKTEQEANVKIYSSEIARLKQRIHNLKDDNWFERAMNDTDGSSKMAKNEIIHTYITSATLEQQPLTLIDSHKEELATIINVQTINGYMYKFAYFPKRSNELLRTYRYYEEDQVWKLNALYLRDFKRMKQIRFFEKKYTEYREHMSIFNSIKKRFDGDSPEPSYEELMSLLSEI